MAIIFERLFSGQADMHLMSVVFGKRAAKLIHTNEMQPKFVNTKELAQLQLIKTACGISYRFIVSSHIYSTLHGNNLKKIVFKDAQNTSVNIPL